MLQSIISAVGKIRVLELHKATKQLFYIRRFATVNTSSIENHSSVKDASDHTNVRPPRKTVNPFSIKDPPSADGNAAPYNPAISSEEKERRLKVLQLEVDIANQEGRRVPSLNFFQKYHWEHVLTLPSKSARMKYYGFLWQVEIKKQAKLRRKEEKAADCQERLEKLREEREQNGHIIYGLGHVSMFMRIYDSTINHWMNHRLIRAMQYSPKMVLDCSYDQYMTQREAENAAKQLMLCFAENRSHDDPFDLHYCNVNLDTPCMQSLQRYIPTMLNMDFPMNVHQKCFTELFPKDKIVYLTPHCRTDLVEYNHDDVYIVGAMVDTVNNEPLSLAKAKKLGLRMARLPLDRYLQWGAGSGKSLTLNQMIKIMLDVRKTGDWRKALSHVPRRKLYDQQNECTRGRNDLQKGANRVNVKIGSIMEVEDFTEEVSRLRSQRKKFNVSSWGAKKKGQQGS
ncbi:mitochondrial ribonuclease P protein 1 homolog [Stomoxys calcitrans]|uniref:mitochondrial ribonuclease P protein 1 homolog n=1 Tax=Stomoxys calcitrans TaxID=35570 RepID=UPI0027E26EEC|nr:mitochondrial ribonuclease P protein 1 homolog [Stomoxys calcitrans]